MAATYVSFFTDARGSNKFSDMHCIFGNLLQHKTISYSPAQPFIDQIHDVPFPIVGYTPHKKFKNSTEKTNIRHQRLMGL